MKDESICIETKFNSRFIHSSIVQINTSYLSLCLRYIIRNRKGIMNQSRKRMGMFIIACLGLLRFSTARADCDIGWTNAGGDFCYKTSTERMTWGSAQEVKYKGIPLTLSHSYP